MAYDVPKGLEVVVMAAKNSKSEKRPNMGSVSTKRVGVSKQAITSLYVVGSAWVRRDAVTGASAAAHPKECVAHSLTQLAGHSHGDRLSVVFLDASEHRNPAIGKVEAAASQFRTDGLSILSVKVNPGGGLEVVGTLPEEVALDPRRSHHIRHVLMTAAVNAGSWIDDIDLDYVSNGESTGPRSSMQEQSAGAGRPYRP